MQHIKPLVTAIIPVYNRPEQVKEAVLSVLSQTWRPLELIVGDDGSTDLTGTVVQRMIDENETSVEMVLLELPHTGYPGAVRNSCAEAAKGEYLAFLDSDDLWRPEKLEKQIHPFLRNPSLRISHTREEWNREGKIISQARLRHKREGDLFQDSLKKCIIGPSTVMIRKDLFLESGGFRDDLEIAEDYEYWLRLTAVEQVRFLDEPLTVKRAGHEDQLSEKYGHIELFRIEGLKTLVDKSYFHGWYAAAAARELSRKCQVYGRGCMKREKMPEGREYMELSGYYEIMAEKLAGE
jgi:glycosyltransferase involved in cell wall biosynthesis